MERGRDLGRVPVGRVASSASPGSRCRIGASALWQSLGFTAGYLALLLFVAAPLRRFGSYTIPDFAEARLRSPRLRGCWRPAIVLVIGGFYLVPQLKGAGLALNVVVGLAVLGRRRGRRRASSPPASPLGGMRGITYVQAFQFWVKVFAISVPGLTRC